MIGVWTYTQAIPSGDVFPFEWVKWDIRPNGKMVAYYARPVDDDWGKGEEFDYEVVTGKYTDTGERYFGIRPKSQAISALYHQGALVLRHISYATGGAMQRGEKNPFSK